VIVLLFLKTRTEIDHNYNKLMKFSALHTILYCLIIPIVCKALTSSIIRLHFSYEKKLFSLHFSLMSSIMRVIMRIKLINE